MIGVDVLINLLPPHRRRLIEELRGGELDADKLAERLGITSWGVRSSLRPMIDAGAVIVVRRSGDGPGRPRHYFSLAPELAPTEGAAR